MKYKMNFLLFHHRILLIRLCSPESDTLSGEKGRKGERKTRDGLVMKPLKE